MSGFSHPMVRRSDRNPRAEAVGVLLTDRIHSLNLIRSPQILLARSRLRSPLIPIPRTN